MVQRIAEGRPQLNGGSGATSTAAVASRLVSRPSVRVYLVHRNSILAIKSAMEAPCCSTRALGALARARPCGSSRRRSVRQIRWVKEPPGAMQAAQQALVPPPPPPPHRPPAQRLATACLPSFPRCLAAPQHGQQQQQQTGGPSQLPPSRRRALGLVLAAAPALLAAAPPPAAAEPAADLLESSSSSSSGADVDTTVTDRIYLDVGLCPEVSSRRGGGWPVHSRRLTLHRRRWHAARSPIAFLPARPGCAH